MSFKRLTLKSKILTYSLTSISKRNKQTTASESELDTDLETSDLLHLCHQNTTAAKHLELFYMKTKQNNKKKNLKRENLLVSVKSFKYIQEIDTNSKLCLVS